jgi:hypothetical protein
MSGILMMVSFVVVCAHERVRSRRTPLASALGKNIQAIEIAPSDGTQAAATRTSSDFGRHRFMDSFKANNCTLSFNGRPLS